jgi:thiol-disulfide isomerase/thioredoxin
MRRIFVLCYIMICIQQVYAVEFIKFEKGTFEKAQLDANQGDKFILLDFYASWCTPCKWMEETTFQDREVINIVNSKYIPIKVNIDEFDGFDIKSKYDVRFLPTILVFNKNGKMVERIEETLSPSKMKNLLNQLSHKDLATVTHRVNTSPRESVKPIESKVVESSSILDVNHYKSSPGETTNRSKSLYRVQLGVYTSIEGALKKSDEIKQTFLDDVTIVQDENNDNLLFRVCLGQFKNLDEARSFKTMLLKEFKIKGLVY